mmetsp:Transcript_10272/g.28876  ORF Transcript_10272/g.28876 Transcript_10272/m.28876 type:complete len:365 (-) Transcript_10272:40-1134(-)
MASSFFSNPWILSFCMNRSSWNAADFSFAFFSQDSFSDARFHPLRLGVFRSTSARSSATCCCVLASSFRSPDSTPWNLVVTLASFPRNSSVRERSSSSSFVSPVTAFPRDSARSSLATARVSTSCSACSRRDTVREDSSRATSCSAIVLVAASTSRAKARTLSSALIFSSSSPLDLSGPSSAASIRWALRRIFRFSGLGAAGAGWSPARSSVSRPFAPGPDVAVCWDGFFFFFSAPWPFFFPTAAGSFFFSATAGSFCFSATVGSFLPTTSAPAPSVAAALTSAANNLFSTVESRSFARSKSRLDDSTENSALEEGGGALLTAFSGRPLAELDSILVIITTHITLITHSTPTSHMILSLTFLYP